MSPKDKFGSLSILFISLVLTILVNVVVVLICDFFWVSRSLLFGFFNLLLYWLLLFGCLLVLGTVGSIIPFGSLLVGTMLRPVSSSILKKFWNGLLTILWSIYCLVWVGSGQRFSGNDELVVIDDGGVTLRLVV